MSAFGNILKHLEAKKNSVFFGEQGEVELVITADKATLSARKGGFVVVNTTPTYKGEAWCFDYEDEGEERSIECREEWSAFSRLAHTMLENTGASRQTVEKTTLALQAALKSLFDTFREKTMLVKKYSTAVFSSYSIAIWKAVRRETYTDHLIVSHDLLQDRVYVRGVYSGTETQVTERLLKRESTLEQIKASGVIKFPAALVTEAHYELACQELKKIVDEVFAADALKSAA